MKESGLIIKNQNSFYDYIGTGRFHERYQGDKYNFIKYKEQYKDFGFYPGVYTYGLNLGNKKEINDFIKKIKSKNIPNAVWVEELESNNEIIKALENNDFNLGFKSSAMYLEIDKMADFRLKEEENIVIKLVDNEDLLYEWANILIDGWWTWNKGKEDKLVNIYKDIYKENEKIRLYIAFYKGKPAGTSLSFLDGDSVGLYLISTHPEFRNKGIGKLLTVTPIIEGKDIGYKHTVLHGTDMGKVIYKQLGFDEYFKTRSYWFDLRNNISTN